MKILKGVKIYKIGHGGIGIASMSDGKKILVKGGALPGSIVDLKIVKKSKDYVEAHVISTKKYDPNYADGEIFCPHFYIPKGISEVNAGTAKIGCGGCKWQMMSYEKQLELKQGLVEEAYKKINKSDKKIGILPIIGSPFTHNYRNKIEFSFGVFVQGIRANLQNSSEVNLGSLDVIDSRRNCGFHKQGEFSKIVDVDSCGLISDKANQIFMTIKGLCFESGLPTYDQKTHQGFFRHLVIREGVNTGQLMVNLSIALGNLNDEQTKLREELLEQFKNNITLKENLTTFVITYNEGLADTVKNDKSESKVRWGSGFIHEALNFQEGSGSSVDAKVLYPEGQNSITFRISPFSFFQTNTHGAETLFSTAFKMLGNWEGNILDLYCGTGSIGLSLLKTCNSPLVKTGNLIGIEIVEDAIIDARINAEINALSEQAEFYVSPAEKTLERFPELIDKIRDLGVVIIDPPREGLHKNAVDWIANLKKESDFKLLYISCNPVTMARDVELFLEKGFDLKEVQPVDMFPHTHHCECIAILK